MSTTQSDDFVAGPLTLRERPETLLANRAAYRLTEAPTRSEWIEFAAWVVAHGGEVPYFDEHGLLVRSVYLNEHGGDSGERYHEWLTGSDLVVHDPVTGEFASYGYSITDRYVIEEPHMGSPEPVYVDCTCGHPYADHVTGVCDFQGCGCGS